MKIRTYKRLESGVYRVSIQTEDWSELDSGLMIKFGEPEIDLGGNITDGGSIDFDLDTSYARVMSDSPFVAGFDSDDYADAQDRAETWQDTIETRIQAAVTTLRSSSDGFSGEEITEL
jgi:hypothetical protein